MINFIKYVIRYWTHYRIFEIAKKQDLLEKGVWYEYSHKFMLDRVTTICDISIVKETEYHQSTSGIQIDEFKDISIAEEETNEN